MFTVDLVRTVAFCPAPKTSFQEAESVRLVFEVTDLISRPLPDLDCAYRD